MNSRLRHRLEWNPTISIYRLYKRAFSLCIYVLRVFMICLTPWVSSICNRGGDGVTFWGWRRMRAYLHYYWGCLVTYRQRSPTFAIEPTIGFISDSDGFESSIGVELISPPSNVIQVLIVSKDISVYIFIQRCDLRCEDLPAAFVREWNIFIFHL